MIGIYKFTNKINGKSYIGQSINLEKRKKEHEHNCFNPNYCNYDSKFYRALRKYGLENFDYEVLENCTKEQLNEREVYWIFYFNSYQDGYNSTLGGEDNPSNHEEIVRKRTEKLLNDPEVNKKLSSPGESNPNSKLKETDVRDIRARYVKGETFADVYNIYKDKISRSGFQYVWLGKSWSNIMPEVFEIRPRENRGGSKLTKADVINIRTRYEIEKESKESIYKDYKDKVGEVGFNKILRHLTWKDIIV